MTHIQVWGVQDQVMILQPCTLRGSWVVMRCVPIIVTSHLKPYCKGMYTTKYITCIILGHHSVSDLKSIPLNQRCVYWNSEKLSSKQSPDSTFKK